MHTAPIKSKRFRASLVAASLLLAAGVAWSVLGYPTSFDEALFLGRLSVSVKDGSRELRLAELMPGDWELVCDSHAYDDSLYLKRYDKTFPPVAPPQDGVWGLIFIARDGSYSSAVGSCGRIGAYVTVEPLGCVERSKATLTRTPSNKSCPAFSFRHG
jgi:hypothetical protein